MLLYVHRRRLFVIGGILFFIVWYFLTFLHSLICTSIYILGTFGYLYWRTRKEVRHQLGLGRTRRKGKQVSTQRHNQTINTDCNHVNSFNDYYNNSNISWESKLTDVRYRNIQTAAGPLLVNNFVKAKDLSTEDVSRANKYQFNSSRYKAPVLSNTARMTATAKRRYPINQEKYSLIGQLPIVQLKKEPLPILKNFNTSMVYNPVTVKIAPPEDYKRSSSRWKFVYSSEKGKSRNDPCDARTVIAALKENRKRSSKDKDDITVEAMNTKRQRRDSSSSSGSAFIPTNSSPAMGNIESASLNIQKCPNNPSTSLSSSSRNKRPRNNAITSSYSSSIRLMEKLHDSSLIQQLAKRKATAMDTSTPKKFIKISERNEDLPEQKAENVKNTSQSDQSMENDKTPEDVQDVSSNVSTTPPLKKGVSYRRNLSLYTSLGTPIQAAPIPAHLPTLEEHEKDKKIEARRLEWLLSGVNEAFQSKDGLTAMNENRTMTTSTSSTMTSITSASESNLNKTLPVSISDIPITSSPSLFNKVADSSSLTLFGSSAITTTTTTTTLAIAVTQTSFLSSQPSSTATPTTETTTNITRSLLPSSPFSFESQSGKVTSVDSIFSALSGTSTTSPSVTLPQISLSSSTVTTASISLPISSSVVQPTSESYSISFPSNITLSTFSATASKQTCNSNTVTSTSSVSSGNTVSSVLPTVTVNSLTKPTTTASGGFTFSVQPSSFAFSSGTQSSGNSSGGFNFPLTTASNVGESNIGNKSEITKIAAITTAVTSPVSIAVTSSHPSFHVTTSLIISPSNGLVTTTATTVNTTNQSLFPLGTSTKPFIFGSTNGQRPSLFGGGIQPQTELTTTQNEKTVFKTFNSQIPLVPPSIVTVTSSNQAASNSFMSQSAMISPNQNANIFGTGGPNAFASSVTNAFGTNSQSSGFGQNQAVFASPNTAVSQSQAPTFGSNQGTFVSGSTSQSAFMTSGQMQPVLGTTNAFNASNNMQNTFGTAAPAPFQFGTNTGNFNFNFSAPTKYNYGPLPSFGTPAPPSSGSTLFSIGSGKLDRKTSSSRRRLAKK